MNHKNSRPPLPDRLSNNPRSPHYVAEVLENNVGIILNGKLRDDVEEYCLSEGWVKINSSKSGVRIDIPQLETLNGVVEVFYNTYPK